MLPRPGLLSAVRTALGRSKSVALLGPRQCGKTTLAREVAQIQNAEYFDLEDPTDLARLTAPKLTLEQLEGLVIIDEFQQRPDLLPLLRVLLDRQPLPARFLLLGSASPDIVRGASESLAGRIEFVHMSGFDLSEVGPDARSRLWLRGGFPPAFLAASDADSFAWRGAFVQTFVERRTAHHEVDAASDRRLATRPSLRGIPGRPPVRLGRGSDRDAARPAASN